MRVHWRVKGESRNRARLHQEGLRSIPDIPWDPATEGGGLGLKRLGYTTGGRRPQRPAAARGAVRDRTSDQIERATPQSQRVGRIGWAGRRENWCSRKAGAVGEPGAAKDEEPRQGQVSKREQRKPRSSEQRAGESARLGCQGYCVALPGGGARDSVTLLLRANVPSPKGHRSESE